MIKDVEIDEAFDKILNLLHGQQKVLDITDELLSMKTKLLELSEDELEMQRHNNKFLYKVVICFSILLFISVVLHIVR